MKHYTLILVGDETAPMRRIQVTDRAIKRAVGALVAVLVVLAVGTWDYTRMRSDVVELDGLRIKTAEQTREVQKVQTAFEQMNAQMERLQELERKVRIIANLPGSAAIGGESVTEVVQDEDANGAETELLLPAGVPLETGRSAEGVPHVRVSPMPGERIPGGASHLTSQLARVMLELEQDTRSITMNAELQAQSLDDLMLELDDKRNRLVSMPSVWPAKGWLTSRYGPRISPFTGRRQHHSGIDIAASSGSDIVAPARGRVVFVGRKGHLGNTVVLEHGFGVRTIYGHAKDIHVKIGQEVERGGLLASVGSTGRSTGPHLHYTVEVSGKSRDPLDYIFD
jgi:hypothetical protein